MKEKILAQYKIDKVVFAGDGRCDSPESSAKINIALQLCTNGCYQKLDSANGHY